MARKANEPSAFVTVVACVLNGTVNGNGVCWSVTICPPAFAPLVSLPVIVDAFPKVMIDGLGVAVSVATGFGGGLGFGAATAAGTAVAVQTRARRRSDLMSVNRTGPRHPGIRPVTQ